MRLFYYSLNSIKNERMKARIPKAGHCQFTVENSGKEPKSYQQEVHFSCFNCFSWLLPGSVDHSHLDEEGEKIMPLLKSLFW